MIPDEGYIQESTYSSVSNVTVSGPTTEVNKVSKVVARVSLSKPLTSTTTLEAKITPIGEYGGVPQYLDINHGQFKRDCDDPGIKAKGASGDGILHE